MCTICTLSGSPCVVVAPTVYVCIKVDAWCVPRLFSSCFINSLQRRHGRDPASLSLFSVSLCARCDCKRLSPCQRHAGIGMPNFGLHPKPRTVRCPDGGSSQCPLHWLVVVCCTLHEVIAQLYGLHPTSNPLGSCSGNVWVSPFCSFRFFYSCTKAAFLAWSLTRSPDCASERDEKWCGDEIKQG